MCGILFLNGALMIPAGLSLILAIVSYGIYLWRKKPQSIFVATMFLGYVAGLQIFHIAFAFDETNYIYFMPIYALISTSIFLTYMIKYLRGRKSIDIHISGLGLGLLLFYPISWLYIFLVEGERIWWRHL